MRSVSGICRNGLIALLFIGAFQLPGYAGEELVIYTARNEQLIKPLFDAYQAETGVSIKFITDKEGPLYEKLKAEGEKTPADILITVDAGNLWHAAASDLLQAVDSEILETNIPENLRDPENRWFGFSVRARTIVYNTQKVKPAELSTYESLGNPEWKGRLCLRTSKKVYNQSLVAMMIQELGEPEAQKIVESWISNLATDVFADDTAVLQAVAAGQCDAGIVNTYYFGRIMEENAGLPIALFWPNQDGRGVHVNISGAGITRYAPHRETAVRFLEWLSSEKAQNLFADSNMEYPANPAVPANLKVRAWGQFKQDLINVAVAGELQEAAVKLMDRAKYK